MLSQHAYSSQLPYQLQQHLGGLCCAVLRCAALCCAVLCCAGVGHIGALAVRADSVRPVQIHEEAQRKAQAEAAAVVQEQQRAAEESERLAAAAKQRALTVHQIQAQREAEAKKKCDF